MTYLVELERDIAQAWNRVLPHVKLADREAALVEAYHDECDPQDTSFDELLELYSDRQLWLDEELEKQQWAEYEEWLDAESIRYSLLTPAEKAEYRAQHAVPDSDEPIPF
ncbi:MAG: hypothetical protein ACYC5M_14720 [Anaerolineae bacterium]